MISSGGRTYGTIFSVGSFVQALSPASAAEAAASFSISRRLIPSDFVSALAGNSFSRNSRYSLVPESCSRLCQKRLPLPSASFARRASRSVELGFSALESGIIIFFASLSSVARRTVRQALNFVFLHQFQSQFNLVCGRFVIWIKDL